MVYDAMFSSYETLSYLTRNGNTVFQTFYDLEKATWNYWTGVLSLERRRDVARLCLLYKIVNCLCFFDLNVFFFLVPLALIIHILLL